MSSPEWDLDAELDDFPTGAGHAVAVVIMLAVGLAGLGVGSLAGAAFARTDPARLPPAATLAVRDLYVDTSTIAPGTGLMVGRGMAVLRIHVDNPGPDPIRLSSLALDGVTRGVTVLPLSARVAGHRSEAVDVSVSPDCSAESPTTIVRARLRLAGSSPWAELPVLTSRELAAPGGLCSLLNTRLPRGWQSPLPAAQIRRQGVDLEVTIASLSSDRVAGVLVDGRLLPTVFIGDQLLSTSARLRPGQPTVLRLRGPPPCLENGTGPIPSTMRLLARGGEGLQQQLIIVGPELTRWLRLDCAG
jgi:hypothetical protein